VATHLVQVRAVVLLVCLGEADEAADDLTVVAVQLEQFFVMLAAAAGNVLIRSNFVVQRHYLMRLGRRLTSMTPLCTRTLQTATLIFGICVTGLFPRARE